MPGGLQLELYDNYSCEKPYDLLLNSLRKRSKTATLALAHFFFIHVTRLQCG